MPEICRDKRCKDRMPHTSGFTCGSMVRVVGNHHKTCGRPLVMVMHGEEQRWYHDDGSLCAKNGPVQMSDPAWPHLDENGAPVPAHLSR